MRGFLIRLVALGVFLYAVGLVATVIYVARYADPEPIPQAAAIVVISGPWITEEGPEAPVVTETGETPERVARGIALYQAGRAPLLVMSGGGALAVEGPGDASFMADIARQAGVPDTALRIEARSQSTLQNAWNTARLADVDPAEPILLVTHRYHLARAVPSFRWAGFGDVTPVAADPDAVQTITPWLLLEGVKWPLNVARAAGASAALAFGVPEADVAPWLR